jgi:hypothetical protein
MQVNIHTQNTLPTNQMEVNEIKLALRDTQSVWPRDSIAQHMIIMRQTLPARQHINELHVGCANAQYICHNVHFPQPLSSF